MRINIFSVLLFVLGTLHLLLGGIAWFRRSTRGAKVFMLLMISAAIYTFGYGMEISSQRLDIVLLWTNIEYIGICTLAALWLIFVIQYSGYERWLTWRNILLLFLIPAIVLISKWTDKFHHLIYLNPFLDTSGTLSLLSFERGPMHYVMSVYTATVIISGMVLLIINRRNASLLFRQQTTILILTASMLLFVFIYYVCDIKFIPALDNLDLNPFSMMIMEIGVSWVLFRHYLFDLAPIAREALIENMSDGVIVLDDLDRVVDINPAAQKLFGSDQKVIGLPIAQICQEYPCLLSAKATQQKNVEFEIYGCAGGFYEVNFSDLVNNSGIVIGQLMVLHDISTRKRVEKELQVAKDAAEEANLELRKAWADMERIAATDKLTGLFNRRKFEEISVYELSRAERYNTPLSMIMLDIDHFKQVNDKFGHQVGDDVLVGLSQILAENTRKVDSLFRWGGEEFLIVTPGIEISQACILAEKIRNLVFDHAFPFSLPLTISLGVTQYQEKDTVDSMIRRADDAVYRAKNSGRNRVALG